MFEGEEEEGEEGTDGGGGVDFVGVELVPERAFAGGLLVEGLVGGEAGGEERGQEGEVFGVLEGPAVG